MCIYLKKSNFGKILLFFIKNFVWYKVLIIIFYEYIDIKEKISFRYLEEYMFNEVKVFILYKLLCFVFVLDNIIYNNYLFRKVKIKFFLWINVVV